MATHTVGVVSAGRAYGSQHSMLRVAPLATPSEWNSFCLACATWHHGHRDSHCHRCHAPIFRWVRDDDLHHMHGRSSLGCF